MHQNLGYILIKTKEKSQKQKQRNPPLISIIFLAEPRVFVLFLIMCLTIISLTKHKNFRNPLFVS